YELFVPDRRDAKRPVPAILFVSAGDEPAGWKACEKVCKDGGFVFVGVRGAGNSVPAPKRVRIVLDCTTTCGGSSRWTRTAPTSAGSAAARGSRAASGSRCPSTSAA
ncbi:MAG: hypothetical protein ACKODX_00835, partial [Gemmata sp.]